ncbi:MAG: CreA family protein [Betaproteobacteria bacterium]|nr:CreA family protein [Betaproteobacteria bacterium]
MRWHCLGAGLALAFGLAGAARGERIGEVDTVFKLVGPDHKIVVEAFDDPKVQGVTCHLSRARKGGVSGALGLAEDPSDASIACRQVGPITIPKPLPDKEEVFSESASILFKRVRVVRMFDRKRQVLVYLTYSDKLIEGSPKNAISTVPLLGAQPGTAGR